MKKLSAISIVVCSLLASAAYASSERIPTEDNCTGPNNVFININGNMSSTDTITYYTKYFGEGPVKFTKPFGPEKISGDASDFSTTFGNAACIKESKQAIFAGLDQITTSTHGTQSLTNCGVKVRPKDITDDGKTFNLNIQWDSATQLYKCTVTTAAP